MEPNGRPAFVTSVQAGVTDPWRLENKLLLGRNRIAVSVLARSAATTKRDIQKGMETEFLCYLTKPVRVLEIVDAIKSAMKTI